MSKQFFETLNLSQPPATALQIIDHFGSRYPLGKGLVISDQTSSTIKELHKYWIKQTHELQIKRDKAEEIDIKLIITNQIIQRQKISIGTGIDSHIQYITQTDLQDLEFYNFMSVYVATLDPQPKIVSRLKTNLPNMALVVADKKWLKLLKSNFSAKQLLIAQSEEKWQTLNYFLKARGINLSSLEQPRAGRSADIDNALDILLDEPVGAEFLRLAEDYRLSVLLAAPQSLTHSQSRERDTLAVLAKQVQTLMPPVYDHHYTGSVDDPPFFLSDPQLASRKSMVESLLVAANDQSRHGRLRFARALQLLVQNV